MGEVTKYISLGGGEYVEITVWDGGRGVGIPGPVLLYMFFASGSAVGTATAELRKFLPDEKRLRNYPIKPAWLTSLKKKTINKGKKEEKKKLPDDIVEGVVHFWDRKPRYIYLLLQVKLHHNYSYGCWSPNEVP